MFEPLFSDRAEKSMDLQLFAEFSEPQVREMVAALPEAELNVPRSALIARILPGLFARPPVVRWERSRKELRQVDEAAQARWEARLQAPLEDPSCVGSYTTLNIDHVEVDADWEKGCLTIVQKALIGPKGEAEAAFEQTLARFRSNLSDVEHEIERFNAALPYLVSFWIEARLDGLPITKEAEQQYRDAARKALDELEQEGDFSTIGDVDQLTSTGSPSRKGDRTVH